MRSTLVDSNVLIDLFDEDSEWREWSDAMLTRCAARGPLVINPIVFAEVSAGFEALEDVEAALPETYVRREPLPWEAAFLAGRAFVQYRRRGGTLSRPAPRLLHRRPRRRGRSHAADARCAAVPPLLPEAPGHRALSSAGTPAGYSDRSATSGLTRTARIAGTRLASAATASSAIGTRTKVTGSVAVTS